MKLRLRRFVAGYFSSWWLPSCCAFLAIIVSALLTFATGVFVECIGGVLLIIAFISVLLAAIMNFVRRRWLFATFNLVMLPVLAYTAAFILIMVCMAQPSEDGFADNLTIPSNIEISEPVEPSGTVLATGTRYGKPSLILLNGMQPGIYVAQVWANPGEPGRIYFKAYEVTRNTKLDHRTEPSDLHIGWSGNPRQLFLSSNELTVYNGDWGKPYAARFEVWFVPDSRKPKRKLMEKVFKIEGWQR